MLILLIPIILDELWNLKKAKTIKILIVFLIGYSPQLIWNFWVNHSIFFNGYAWSASKNIEANEAYIQSIYHIKSSSMFALNYLYQNMYSLFWHFLPLLGLLIIFKFWKTPSQKIIFIMTIFNIIFYLSYWWSGAVDLIDRFLMPNYILMFYLISRYKLSNVSHRSR